MIRIGILGCGGMAGGHAKRIAARDDAQLVALCDVNTDITARFIERTGIAVDTAQYADPATMYAEAALDAVIIVTPHTMHFDHASQAIAAGCHVFLEKPMVTDSADARRLAAIVGASDRVFTVGYNTPTTPVFTFLKEVIQERRLGRLELVSGWLSQGWKKGTTGMWRQDPALSGGGQAYDSGAHILCSLVWSVGQPVDAVSGFVDYQECQVDINSVINVRFADGTMAAICIGGNCPAAGAGMQFIFENGRIDIDPWGGGSIEIHDPSGALVYPEGIAHVGPIDNFVLSCQGMATPAVSVQDGINQSDLMDALYASGRSGKAERPQAKQEVAA